MSRYLCHDHPDTLAFISDVVGAEPGKVLLRQTYFYPGGGGQLADRDRLLTTHGEFPVTGIEARGENLWHVIDQPIELHGTVQAQIDAPFRRDTTAACASASYKRKRRFSTRRSVRRLLANSHTHVTVFVLAPSKRPSGAELGSRLPTSPRRARTVPFNSH